ncbi:MAG: TIGR04211 family SH3 domain-containing protein [Deltaproteobacteria bacterium]|nr:MAG: TIGR04211 family SH3 domain-containing protein [Deltaproteobacteria bacterium]
MWGVVKMMKLGVLFFACFFLMVIPAHSGSMYITDSIHVMLRTSPGFDRKIIAMPKSGTQVEVLEEIDEWARVRLPNEKEGWVLTRYLSPGPPSKEVIAKLKSENEALARQVKTLAEENTQLKIERNDLGKALSEQTRTAKALRKSFETLKEESSDFLALKAAYEKTSKDLAAKTKRQAELEEKLQALQHTQTLRWFMGGAAVLLVGLIVGFMARRPRRRSSFL